MTNDPDDANKGDEANEARANEATAEANVTNGAIVAD